jgi:hypothetical protein
VVVVGHQKLQHEPKDDCCDGYGCYDEEEQNQPLQQDFQKSSEGMSGNAWSFDFLGLNGFPSIEPAILW